MYIVFIGSMQARISASNYLLGIDAICLQLLNIQQ